MLEQPREAILINWPEKPITTINCAARTCYNSLLPGIKEQREFVRNLIKNKHETPLEFVQFTFGIFTDRGVSHELVRHRLASFQQESTRYVRFSKDDGGIPVVVPASIAVGSAAYIVWREAMLACEEAYFNMLKLGCKPEIARSVLPTSLATHLWMSMNLREFRHFLTLRLSKKAHPDMRVLATSMAIKVLKNVPDAKILIGDVVGDIAEEGVL